MPNIINISQVYCLTLYCLIYATVYSYFNLSFSFSLILAFIQDIMALTVCRLSMKLTPKKLIYCSLASKLVVVKLYLYRVAPSAQARLI